MPLGRTTRQNILDFIMNGTALAGAHTGGGTYWVTLHTGSPGVDGQTANEVGAGVGYAAQPTTNANWSAATAAEPSVVSNGIAVLFGPAAGAGFGTVTHYGKWNHATNRAPSNFLGFEALTGGPETVANGDSLNFPVGSLTISLV
jgi:hypothetical protein